MDEFRTSRQGGSIYPILNVLASERLQPLPTPLGKECEAGQRVNIFRYGFVEYYTLSITHKPIGVPLLRQYYVTINKIDILK